MGVMMRATFIEDLPTDEYWMASKLYDVRESGLTQHGVPKYMGPITGYFSRPLRLPIQLLLTIPGERGEQSAVRQSSLEYIRSHWDEVSKEIPFVEIDPNGKAWVSEGNHRIMVAAERGESFLPVEVRYFTGGQKLADTLSPENLLWYDRIPYNTVGVCYSDAAEKKNMNDNSIKKNESTPSHIDNMSQ